MIKLIIFDLDGVLVNTKDIHFHALNKALENFSVKYKISKIDHLNKFDGMPTKEKLKQLTKNKNLPKNKYKLIIKDKNKFTENLIKQKIKKSVKLISLFKNLNQEYKIAVASNAIKRTVNQCLTNLHLKKYVHYDEYKKFPVTEHIHFFGFYLGNYPSMSESEVEELICLINSIK